jgi:hypothetical protein
MHTFLNILQILMSGAVITDFTFTLSTRPLPRFDPVLGPLTCLLSAPLIVIFGRRAWFQQGLDRVSALFVCSAILVILGSLLVRWLGAQG